MHSTNSFSKKSVGSVAIGALLIFGIYTILPMTSGAYAQGTVTITTSADAHNNRFFGPALLEVMFTSSQHAADNSPGTAQVTVTAFGNTQTYAMNETSGTSGIFLMYVKVDDGPISDTPTQPANPFSSTNTRLYVGPAGVTGAYPGSSGSSVKRTLEVSAANINEGGALQFTFGGVTKTVTFDDTPATLTLDRTTYGASNNTRIYATLYDPDINLDPTTGNTITETSPAQLLSRANVVPTGTLAFTETGSNTARFEAVLNATELSSGTSAGRSLTATDYKTFIGTSATAVTASGTAEGTSSASYTVQRVSGSLSQPGGVTYAGELTLTVNDLDRNLDSKAQEQLTGRLQITGHGSYNLREQSLNSNTFVPAYGQDRILLTWKQASSPAQGIVNVAPGTDVNIGYQDTLPSSGGTQITSSVTVKITNTNPTLTADKTTVGRSSVIMLEMKDPELNDDAAIIESYTVTFTGNTGTKNATAFNNVSPFSMKIDRNGGQTNIGTPFSVTFTETSANSGNFVAEVDLSDLDATTPLADGDSLKFEIRDILEKANGPTASVTLTVGLEKPSIKVDRSTAPVPRLEGADNVAFSGAPTFPADGISNTGPVDVVVTITDGNRNNSTINQETLQGTTTSNKPSIHTFDGGRLIVTLTPAPGTTFSGNTVVEISDAIKETGFNTGVFEGTITVHATNNDKPAWIGAKMKIEYKGLAGDESVTTTVTFTARQAVLSTSSSTIVNGGEVTFTVSDQDSNRDPGEAESVFIRIRGEGGLDDWLELEETGDNTGVFTATVTVGDKTLENGDDFTVEPHTEVDIFYYDATPSVSASRTSWPDLGSQDTRRERTLQVGSASGSLEVAVTARVGPSASIDVTVFDSDVNTNPNNKQKITGLVTVATDRGVDVSLNLEETDANSGRFVGTINLVPDPSPNTDGTGTENDDEVEIEVLPGDIVSVRYQDESDENGRRTTISRQFQVVSVDPEIKTDKNVYSAGEQVRITLADLDSDTDPKSNDVISVKATSSSDLVGLSNVQLIETGPNTGVFEGTLTLSNQFSSGSLTVRNGDTITIKYTDKYPADYKARVDAGGTTSKDFTIVRQIGSEGTTRTTTPATPTVRDAQNRPLTQVLAGQQVVLSTSIKNNEPASTPYAAIVEVRDSNDITVFLNWQTGTLAADGTTGIGLSWTPDEPGRYTVRVFVLSSLNQPQILSPVVTSTVNVS